ncbi:Threonine dehydrogenase [Saccharopolyspora antimicrobica]|uniref:Threonine dehydrogenase n=2 Tax=Saccharopolyspora antimicrobica TaxID=455193 RepID=A0A1I4VPY2_9PSEU|nr:threonine dehydrogenase-like Zn-dependent dehydrogenase [Saccharopolyspora antimicrobica]SFN03372.1 Threonine dehydrogenase [Saccharopolyspora antimicrobica]
MRAMTVVPGVPGTAGVSSRPEPAVTDGDVLVEGLSVGICGTDTEIVNGRHGAAPPGREELILGHESHGRVLEAPDGSGFAAGDVVAGIVRRPDDCPCCRAGQWDFCRTGRYVERGIQHADGYGSQYWRVPEEFLVKLDPGLGETGVLMEPTTIVTKAWEQVQYIRRRACHVGEVALITGAGPIGLLAAMISVRLGYDTHVYDRSDAGPKPELVRALGATFHVADAVTDIGIRPDAVVEATGAGTVVADLMKVVAPNAVLCLTGLGSGTHRIPMEMDRVNSWFVMGNQVVVGSVNANRGHYEQAADHLAGADRGWLQALLTRKVPLTSWTDALDRGPGDIKVVVDLQA